MGFAGLAERMCAGQHDGIGLDTVSKHRGPLGPVNQQLFGEVDVSGVA